MPAPSRRLRPPGPGLREARAAAHRLAMAPFAFQAARAARDLGLLHLLRKHGPATLADLAQASGLPRANLATLLDACLACELVVESSAGWQLSTVGEVWLRDPMVIQDADFAQEVCWHGLAELPEALRSEQPAGLRHLGPWATIYAGLSQLPADIRRAWDAYDHGHSDSAFAAAIALLRTARPRRVLDVGANTGRFALLLLNSDPDLHLTLLDHPDQVAQAELALAEAGLDTRTNCCGLDLLDHARPFPGGQDAVWMSQFLDCFGPSDVIALLRRARAALAPGGRVWVLECCPDRQTEPIAADSLRLASLYFVALANGVSRFYRASDLIKLASEAGLRCAACHDSLGTAHTLFVFTRTEDSTPSPMPETLP